MGTKIIKNEEKSLKINKKLKILKGKARRIRIKN